LISTNGGVSELNSFPATLWTGMWLSSINGFPMTASAKVNAESIADLAVDPAADPVVYDAI